MNTSPIKLWKFNGGVHPPFHKEESNQTPITFAGIPDQLVLPLQQHIGEAAEPLVQVGDKVAKGQLIAHMESGLGANIHAPTSGKISVIEERPLPHISGLSGLCIVIDTDGKDSWGKHKFGALTDYNNIDPSELLTRIQQAGIVGLGGATFPTAVKLSASNAIKTLIINGAECEPYITCDDRLMRDKPAEIIAGIRILQTLLKPENCLIGIEDNKPEAIEALRAACSNNTNGNDKIEVVAIPTLYPSGGEKQLIEILTGQQVPVGGLPLDLGLIGLNVGTVYSIYKAIIEGEPLLSRIVTVTGNGINQPQNFEVLIGTSFNYLAEQAGGYTKMADHLIMGGPMMGFALEDDQVPVIKATNCALITSTTVLSAANSEYANQPTLPCIRCGKCMDVCPVKLLPQQMYWHIRAKDFEKAQDHNINDCIDCGCCSYVCPSHIPLVDYFRFAKNEIRDQQITQ
ncbi:MAG: electron transport complex subunit RsxC, partial [Cocleimonas sp.]